MKLMLCALLLASCAPRQPKEETSDYILPPELQGCRVFLLVGNGSSLRVVKCPGATATTTQAGKSTEALVEGQ